MSYGYLQCESTEQYCVNVYTVLQQKSYTRHMIYMFLVQTFSVLLILEGVLLI